MTGQMETRCTNQIPSCRDDGTDGDQVHQSESNLQGWRDRWRSGAPIRTRAAGIMGQMETRCTNQNPSCMDDRTDGGQVHQPQPELHVWQDRWRPGAPIRTRAAWMTGQMETRCTNQNPSCTDNRTDGDQVHQPHHVRHRQDTASVQWLNTEPESLPEKKTSDPNWPVPLRKMSSLRKTSTGRGSGTDVKKLETWWPRTSRNLDHILTQKENGYEEQDT